MRSLVPVPQFLALSACLLAATSLLQAQAGNAAPSAPAAGRAGQMQLSSATPLTETENLDVYPAAPEGFNVVRENIPHGEVKVVEYDSKTLGLRRMLRVYTPPGLHRRPQVCRALSPARPGQHQHRMDAAGPRSDHHRQPAGR